MWNKFLLVVMIIFLSLIGLRAQKDSIIFQTDFYIGAQYGISWNDVQFSPTIEQKTFNGKRLSFVLRYVSDPHLGLQLELGYDQRGWLETRDTLSSTYSRSIDYAEMAFYTHISIGNRFIRPVILLGSYLSYPIGEQETYPSEWETPDSYYGNPLPKRLQFGLAGGVGIELVPKKSPVSFLIDGRYRTSLGGIFPTKDGFVFSNSKGFMAQISGLYRF